jgi:hypothetical protein
MFIVHRHSHGMPNMEFRMHKNGLHYYDPRDVEFTLINTVSENKEGFTKRQIRDAETARTFYATLSYPSWTDKRLPSVGPGRRHCIQDMGKERGRIEG